MVRSTGCRAISHPTTCCGDHWPDSFRANRTHRAVLNPDRQGLGRRPHSNARQIRLRVARFPTLPEFSLSPCDEPDLSAFAILGPFGISSDQRRCADRLNPPPCSTRVKRGAQVGRECHRFERRPDAMRLRILVEPNGAFPTKWSCEVTNVGRCGLRAFRSRRASSRQSADLIVLAHIKDQLRPSRGDSGRPRMTELPTEIGRNVGRPSPGR